MTNNTIKIMTTIQALMLSAYGFCAILLHRSMMSYDIYSVSNAGSPVHLCYLATMVLGIVLIIRGLVKDRKKEGFFRSAEFITPVVITALCLVFSQANTVYTSTSGGTFGGFLGYAVRSLLSGNDPIDAFVYGSMTVPKYLFVVVAGLVAASITLLRRPAAETSQAADSSVSLNTEAIKARASAAVEDGSRMVSRATTVASAAISAAREAAKVAARETAAEPEPEASSAADEAATADA